MGMTTLSAAEYLGLTPDHVAKLCKLGRIQATRHGPLWNIDANSVEDYKRVIASKKRTAVKREPRDADQERNRALDNKIFAIFEEMRAIELINQVSRCIQSADPLSVLNIAPLLKSLLIDNPPVIKFLVPDYAKFLRFEVGRIITPSVLSRAPASQHLLIQDSFDPYSSSPPGEISNFNLQDFLGVNVLLSNGKGHTVAGVILFTSYTISHSQKQPETAHTQILNMVRQKLCPGGITPALRLYKAIGQVVMRAIAPYLDDIPLLSNG